MVLRAAIISFAITVVPSLVAAQTAIQIPLQFDFINPGAKSLALGGAFSGIADDATAGFANPAGLRELGRPELSVEVRGRWLDTPFLQRGRLSGTVSNELTDVIAGPVFGEMSDSHIQVPYLSVVFPYTQQGWVVAGFRHELTRISQVSFSEGVFQKDPAEFTSRRERPQEVDRKLAITHYGASIAKEIDPRIAVGATLSAYTFRFATLVRRFDTAGFLGAPVPSVELGRATQEGDDVAFAPTVGVRVCLRRCDERQTTSARFGAVYRHGPSFDFETLEIADLRSNRFRVPHVIAVGGALEVPRTGRRLLFSGEIRRIGYSRLKEDFLTDQTIGEEDKVGVDDGIEVHAGFQYTVETHRWLPRFRAGIWSDPDHSTNFIPGPVEDHPQLRLTDELLSVALSKGARTTHVSAGIGLTFSPQLEWNFGADFAERSTIVSASVIVRLGR